jgi:hypothetical protein
MMSIAGLSRRALRARFMESRASAFVDNRPVPFESLSVRAMNFGQHWRTPDVPLISYSLELPGAYFVAFLAEPEQLPALIEDTRRFPEWTEALDTALFDAQFPGAADAVKNPVLARELARFFAHEALLRWLGDGPPEFEPGFVLNSIDSVHLGPTGLSLEGEGRMSGITVAYQDV